MKYITSECVTKGHPDKICDQISDAILDECLRQDKNSRVAVETAVTTQYVLIMGEVTTKAKINYEEIARKVIKEIGYTDENLGFDYKNCKIDIKIHEQSPDIAGATKEEKMGAGDQGIMFGYACDDTENLMPAAIYYAKLLAKRLTEVRENGVLPYLRPDGKTQVTAIYESNVFIGIDKIVISTQHNENISNEQLTKDITKYVVREVIPQYKFGFIEPKIIINPSGKFVLGGPAGDSGLTGRKIIVDTYGGYCPHGGGAFSGKDPTKVDRSAAYMARYIAKNIVAKKLAKKCLVQLAYAIGIEEPVSINIDTFGTGTKVSDEELERMVLEIYNLTPKGIIDFLELRTNLIYQELAENGHIGNAKAKWEKVDE